ncbi:glycerophosphodiester phosphodiesterase family protein [Halomonas korlensis]|uniref:Glycerophosphoryl diester phosphodiesterase n=1 Tax=Halomonas korlensis TaxID=463301 RepID=A0A1I7JNS5_9GAMM|nr:glycerophosphodiester phosphodiesterase family protein [Halomonas korlensis]SFU86809.1 glycerophosphoryl diester phosphodiesterase [Halomonas korlensis]
MPNATTASALPRTIAHRGLSARAPENTLTAVREAKRAGCDWVELDVQLLGDGTPVIWHDNGVRRCSNTRGKLAKLTLDKARALDVGSWFHKDCAGEPMATLEEMLALIGSLDMGLNLELKVNRGRSGQALVDTALPMALKALPAEQLVVSCFDVQTLSAARAFQRDAELLRIGLLYDKLPAGWRKEAERLDAFSLHLNWRKLKKKDARDIKDAGYALFCYTPNDPIAFQPIWDWGVDGVISDDPALFTQYLPDGKPSCSPSP